ncbi:MAG: molecular chaperone HtpG, partial [Oscillospiraceae bacterium]|nr:molecular chaperone HtpG [Oscillospiraceae bacterium]
MAKKQFKAESKRLLELMINSIYTHKEIFLRELVSNGSDALDKLYYKSMSENLGLSRGEFEIVLALDKTARTLTITDNGIGMSKEELENNLGVIAKSGTLDFKARLADEGQGSRALPDDAQRTESSDEGERSLIGQFGVGFYSAFMVAGKVEVKSRQYGSDEAFMWSSEGADGYTVTPCDYEHHGTQITLFIKENTGEERYDEFMEQYRIKNIVEKYSDYIRYPIKMELSSSRLRDDADELPEDADKYESTSEVKTLNSMIPIWKKSKGEIKDGEYNEFYTAKFHDFSGEPLAIIHDKTEGTATYSALMFIPQKAPFDFYTKEYEKGLQLYSSGVMIMDKCGDLLPDHFSFVKGLVDSEDLSLNISRELLQHDRQLKVMAKSIDRSIRSELKKLLTNEREKYTAFWKSFGTQIKFGVYNSFGQNSDTLKDLLLFHSSHETDADKLTTLAEYVERMGQGSRALPDDAQRIEPSGEDERSASSHDSIYFAAGDSVTQI